MKINQAQGLPTATLKGNIEQIVATSFRASTYPMECSRVRAPFVATEQVESYDGPPRL
jgi:hypothetical protein